MQDKTTAPPLSGRDKAMLVGISVAVLGFSVQFGPGFGLGLGGAMMALCAAIDRPMKEVPHV